MFTSVHPGKKGAPLLPEGTVKCTHMIPEQTHREHQIIKKK